MIIKRIIVLLIMGMLASCSINEENDINDYQIDEKFLTVTANDCPVESFEFEKGGSVTVMNDNENIYLILEANQNFEISKFYYQVADSPTDFPTEVNGRLNPRKLIKINTLDKGVTNYVLTIEKEEMSFFSIAIYGEFKQKAGPTVAGWAGDVLGGDGSWVYFDFSPCDQQSDPCTEFSAGDDKIKVLTLTEAIAIPDIRRVKETYLGMLDSGVPLNGTFEPTIEEIVEAFDSEGSGGITGDYTTIYIITNEDCVDSVELTLRIIPD